MDPLTASIREAMDTLLTQTGHDADALFGERVLGDFTDTSPSVAHAAGVVEGAGIALGLTALELLDELGVT